MVNGLLLLVQIETPASKYPALQVHLPPKGDRIVIGRHERHIEFDGPLQVRHDGSQT
jgi:hypothetical protein